jgi:hypothetical protein
MGEKARVGDLNTEEERNPSPLIKEKFLAQSK